ncbi:MAG: polyketide synthase 7 [Actinomycetota bacterium]|nr:polyketide synthase 7 [Actinomycetota bacterium]
MNDDAKLLPYLKKVTADLAATREELGRLRAAATEPVAVVSMACRFPGGVRTPEDLWDLLAEERDAVGPFPADRGWDPALLASAGDGSSGSVTGRGAFLHDAAGFDPQAFGISPREALAMDPQQRLTLEVAWEAFERAGLPTSSLRGSRTGVFVGATSFSYGGDYVDAPEGLEGHLVTGNVTSVLSGRVSYTFGLEGPAVTIDTACSSALVCLHLAVQAIRRGDCTAALAGGVCVMSRPGVFLEFSRQGGLAPDGRCKSFSADADGTGWGEGAGLLLLEKLSDARRLGHPVLAVVRGSAWNGDGASNGLAAPNGRAQQRVIRAALTDAGLRPGDVDAVEAHGTGTRLGDPIEGNALLATYGRDRDPRTPLWLGSLKSNIAHTQAASGAGGLIKVILALAHETLPKTLHVTEPSPEITWSRGAVQLLTRSRPWPVTPGRLRRAAVSGFGVSGTNAHVILEEPPAPDTETAPGAATAPGTAGDSGRPAARPLPFLVSARTPAALAAQAAELRSFVRSTGHDLADVAAGLVSTRSSYEHRAVVVAGNLDELDAGLASVVAGAPDDRTVTGEAADELRPVLVFPGQGSQWPGMAVELLDSSSAFAARLTECSDAVEAVAGYSVIDVLRERTDLDPVRADVVQPTLWAVMVSLADLWRVHGVTPSAVIGHSQGEIAAAAVCGALTLDDAARVCVLRSRALLALAGRGGMLSLVAGVDTVRALIEARGGQASVAAVNGPSAVVVSGAPDVLAGLSADAEAAGIRARLVDVDYASHSPDVDELRDRIEQDLRGIRPRPGHIPFISTVTGEVTDTATLDARYWVTNLRRTVQLEAATRTALRRGHRLFIEASPHPVLGMALASTAQDAGVEAVVTGSLRRGDGGPRRFLQSLAAVQVRGAEVSWAPVLGPPRRRVDLPTYRFQRERYWYTPAASTRATDPGDDLAHVTTWQAAEAAPASVAGRWVVLAPAGDRLAGRLRDRLARAGGDALAVTLPDLPEDGGRTAVATILTEALGDTPANGTGGIVVLMPSTGDPVGTSLAAVQAHLDGGHERPLWFLTSGACAVGAGDPVPHPEQAAVVGLGGSYAAERPGAFGGTIDLPATVGGSADGPGDRLLDHVVAAFGGRRGEQLAVRDPGVFARRLVKATPSRAARTWVPTGTVVIAGGLGSLGSKVAEWMAARGAGHLLLLGRRGTGTPGAADLVDRLTAAGAEATVVACDASDAGQVAAALARVPAGHPVSTVVNAAGAGADDRLGELTLAGLRESLRSRASVSLALREATASIDLGAFVQFSALAGTVGVAGQGGYAAANAVLDALALRWQSEGVPAASVAWSAWSGSSTVDEQAEALLRTRGVVPLEAERALTALGAALDADGPYVLLADVDWPALVASGAVAASPVLDGLLTGARAADGPGSDGEALRGSLAGLRPEEARAALRDLVRGEIAAVLGYDSATAFSLRQPFKSLGVDSLTAVQLRNRLATVTGLRLPVTLAFDHPHPEAVADLLHEQLVPKPGDGADELVDGLEAVVRELGTAAAGDPGTPGAVPDLLRTRDGILDRLRELVRAYERTEEDAPDALDLDDASDDEFFDLLDKELDARP